MTTLVLVPPCGHQIATTRAHDGQQDGSWASDDGQDIIPLHGQDGWTEFCQRWNFVGKQMHHYHLMVAHATGTILCFWRLVPVKNYKGGTKMSLMNAPLCPIIVK